LFALFKTRSFWRINKLSEQSVGAVCNRTSSGVTQMALCAHCMIMRLQTAPTKENFLPGYFVNPPKTAKTTGFKATAL